MAFTPGQVSEIVGATTEGEEILVVEQTEELIPDDEPGEQTTTMTDDDLMMPRSSPDGSTDVDLDDEQHGSSRIITVSRNRFALAAQAIPPIPTHFSVAWSVCLFVTFVPPA